MMTRTGAAAAIAILTALTLGGCTGGSESNAAEEQQPARHAEATQPQVNARAELEQISGAIPIYAGAEYRDELTKRDLVMIRNQFGPQAQVYTLATDDSFPQVYHYYTTYLAQFRGFPARDTYPSQRQQWRTLEVKLNEAMQDPFIPGRALSAGTPQVTLQIAETEAEPRTVIRYIVTPPAPAPPVVAAAAAAPATDPAAAAR
jgi:hypothetical protein